MQMKMSGYRFPPVLFNFKQGHTMKKNKHFGWIELVLPISIVIGVSYAYIGFVQINTTKEAESFDRQEFERIVKEKRNSRKK
jgi:hypothetical protein